MLNLLKHSHTFSFDKECQMHMHNKQVSKYNQEQAVVRVEELQVEEILFHYL